MVDVDNAPDPFAGIKQEVWQLVTEDKLKMTEVPEIIEAIALLSQSLTPTWKQKLMLKIGLVREEDLWQLAYQERITELEQVLSAEQIKMVKQVIIEGVKK